MIVAQYIPFSFAERGTFAGNRQNGNLWHGVQGFYEFGDFLKNIFYLICDFFIGESEDPDPMSFQDSRSFSVRILLFSMNAAINFDSEI